jgi:hypothetical protein
MESAVAPDGSGLVVVCFEPEQEQNRQINRIPKVMIDFIKKFIGLLKTCKNFIPLGYHL